MEDLAYKTWKIKNDDKLIKFNIDLYFTDFLGYNETKLNFDFINNNIALKYSSDTLFLKYLNNIIKLLYPNEHLKQSSILDFLNTSKLIRKSISFIKKEKTLINLKPDIYIYKEAYNYLNIKINFLKKCSNNKDNNIHLRLSDLDTFNIFKSLIIPCTIDNKNKVIMITLFNLLCMSDFTKYFFKVNKLS